MAERLLFVTGTLAKPALQQIVGDLAAKVGFDYEIAALKIKVAALMQPEWVARQLRVPEGVDRIVLPGWCQGDLACVQEKAEVPVELGPKDMRDLPEHFGQAAGAPAGYGAYDIEILAEINHAPRLACEEIVALARRYRDDGADVIDLGCDPAERWVRVGDCVRYLRDGGFRVSIDSFEAKEVHRAVAAGAELVLSVHAGEGGNLELARDLGCEVVAVPHPPGELSSLEAAIEKLDAWGVAFRIDPIIEPIAFGFAQSLGRYLEARRRWPDVEMMMGVGNLTELTDVDSAGVNVLLAGFCQELAIRSILTTEVINWARNSVKEWNLARRLVHYACKHRVLPKHLEPGLHLLRDAKPHEHGAETLAELAKRITDPNFRIFAEGGEIHVMNSQGYHRAADPFVLFETMLAENAIDPSHAFYLGYEMAKAVTALTLSKGYQQDQALRWGFLTREEASHREAKRRAGRRRRGGEGGSRQGDKGIRKGEHGETEGAAD